jgi:hypothetical protein
MKKIISVILCISICLTFALPASAYESKNAVSENSLAVKLYELKLLKGAGTNDDGTINFDLSGKPNRIEALVMLLRALGKGEEAENYQNSHPFTDVPEWADRYVAYAYDKGLAHGVSVTLFDAGGSVTLEMYLTFMLRALGYSDKPNGDFSWNSPRALAAWCRIIPPQVLKTDFTRSDMVYITCAALFAQMKGTQLALYEKLESEGAFTKEAFEKAFPDYPLQDYLMIEKEVSGAIAERYKFGLVDYNVYALENHYIAEAVTDGDTLKVSALVAYGKYTIHKDGNLGGSSDVAPWLFELDTRTLKLRRCRPAYEIRGEGLPLESVFSQTTLNALDNMRSPLRMAGHLVVQMRVDSGAFKFRQPTYEEALAKAKASIMTPVKTLELDACTALLGKPEGKNYYFLYLVFKKGSVLGEGETQLVMSSTEGTFSLSDDKLKLYYSYHFTNGEYYGITSLTGGVKKIQSGTFTYEFELNTGNTVWRVVAD